MTCVLDPPSNLEYNFYLYIGREINSTETDGETKETDNNIPIYVLIFVPIVGGIVIIILVILAVCIRIQARSSTAPENDGTEMDGLI